MNAPGSKDEARPLVSVIVPSYNQGRFLRQTLDSILSQDYRPLEVLVMDGASTDDTLEILREYAGRHSELRWWSERDSGVADAVNKGLMRAQGVYAGIQSSDDFYRPRAVTEAVAEFLRNPDLGLVYGETDIVDESGRFLLHAVNRLAFTPARFLARCTIVHQSSAFFRLDLARELGGWNPEYFCCDTELWLRMIFQAPAWKVDRIWSAWRKHHGQRDREALKMWQDWGRMVKQSNELRHSSWHLRLAAEAGRSLMALDYNPRSSPWFRLFHLWRAILLYPPSVAGIHPKTMLLPGFARPYRWLRDLIFAVSRT